MLNTTYNRNFKTIDELRKKLLFYHWKYKICRYALTFAPQNMNEYLWLTFV